MRFMNKVLAAASFATLAVASSASAAPIIVDALTNAPLAIGNSLTDFNARTVGMTGQTTNTGIVVTFTGLSGFVQGSNSGQNAAPVTTATNGAPFGQGAGADTTVYVSANPATPPTPGTVNLALPYGGSYYFGLLWGSIDTYNSITFTQADGSVQTLDATTVFASNPTVPLNGSASQYVNFTSTSRFTNVLLSSTQRSFEADNVATAVPEPAAWAMMILGVGLVGGAMRRRAAVRVSYAG